MFRVPLPKRTTLTHLELKRTRSPHRSTRPTFDPALRKLFLAVTTRKLTWYLIDSLTTPERLQIASAICDSLHRLTSQFATLQDTPSDAILEQDHEDPQWEPEVHLTPPELAQAIATYALSLLEPNAPVHFGDPAVGNGAFYAALLRVLPKKDLASAVGVDISARQVEAAQSRWGHRGLTVMRADYLHLERLEPRTLILANPPYLRHQDIPASYKRRLRERASVIADTLVDAKSGQYVYFLILSHRWLAADGVAAWLVPSGFMRSQYGQGVRRYLTEEVALVRIHQFGVDDPQFENAKVLPAVVVFRKTIPKSTQEVTFSVGGTLDSPESLRVVTIGTLRKENRWSLSCPRHHMDTSALAIGDVFSVRRGIATGANDFFVLARKEARALDIPDSVLRPILPKSRRLQSDIVERDGDGWPIVEPQLCVIDCGLAEEEIRLRYPRLNEYLAGARDRGILERNLVRNRRLWYQQEQREPAMFLCTYMGRGTADRLPLRFIWNKSDAIATNAYLMLYPSEELARVLKTGRQVQKEVFDLLQRAAADTVMQLSRTYSGGLKKIEPRELLQVRLPDAPEWLLRIARSSGGVAHLWSDVRRRTERGDALE